MTEILKGEEIDALLGAISKGEIKTEEGNPPPKENPVLKVYDFRRPDKFSRDQIRTLQMMHQTFARLMTTKLSARMRSAAAVNVVSVDTLTYEEFLRSIPNPSVLGVIDMDPLPGASVLEIDPLLAYTLIDRMAGGNGEGLPPLTRELTDIEMILMEEVMADAVSFLNVSWENVIPLISRLGNIETNPNFAQIVPPNDMVLLVTMECSLGSSQGMMNLALPYITIESIVPRLSARFWFTSPDTAEGGYSPALVRGMGSSACFETLYNYKLRGSDCSLNDLLRMKAGARIVYGGADFTGVEYRSSRGKGVKP